MPHLEGRDGHQGRATQPEFFRARVGRRRSFLSAADMEAYEAGYLDDWPGEAPDHNTPRAQGYWDRERDVLERDHHRCEAAHERLRYGE